MKFITIAFFLICSFLHRQPAHAQHWKEIKTVEDLNTNYPELINHLFSRIDLTYDGLDVVDSVLRQNDTIEACKLLIQYYQHNRNGSKYRKSNIPPTDISVAKADTILKNVFTIQNVKGKVPWGDDGHRDWHYKGPNNDREWAWLSNRHFQIDTVYHAYLKTGNSKYVSYIDEFLRDFIIKSQPYPEKWGTDAIWRGLEVSYRNKYWTSIFYGTINNDLISDATKLLLLSSLPDHAHYSRHFHAKKNNWLTMELSGLAVIAAHFPEFKGADEWLDYAIDKMGKSITEQVYPDGVQKELSSHYHYVTIDNFEQFKSTCEIAGKALPEFYHETLQKMYNYLAQSIRPNGYGVLNNDSDLDYNFERLEKANQKYDIPNWKHLHKHTDKYISNPDEVSFIFPWAGQFISRNHYGIDAHWSFFDIGPWGTGHQHKDKLHLSVAAFGKDFLVDSGRFAYTGAVAKKFRKYAQSSAGHNTLLIDGQGQAPGPKETENPLSALHYKITDVYDYAWGSFDQFDDLEGTAEHQRTMLYVRDEFWIITDRVVSDQPRSIETLWHWHPEHQIQVKDQIVSTNNSGGNLAIIPVNNQDFEISNISGAETPNIQGWYSSEYNKFRPNTTTIYKTTVRDAQPLVWILYPFKGEKNELKAKIKKIDKNGVYLKIKTNNDHFDIYVPYTDSNKVDFKKK
ncbi:Heparinase II/III-like protein [Zhouia amylolytica]|uniref:Heparinase II/III-like protein n=1 Tax=Zhouia amylolytica TaxID=376730 RepID=A0A1I6VFV4_9FLAO|nr:alginate lyase family protein [Zhouia amylolytica]SFT12623.1 Heparinase II/III-like protein [Zhouia amylolytica]